MSPSHWQGRLPRVHLVALGDSCPSEQTRASASAPEPLRALPPAAVVHQGERRGSLRPCALSGRRPGWWPKDSAGRSVSPETARGDRRAGGQALPGHEVATLLPLLPPKHPREEPGAVDTLAPGLPFPRDTATPPRAAQTYTEPRGGDQTQASPRQDDPVCPAQALLPSPCPPQPSGWHQAWDRSPTSLCHSC